MLLRLGMMLLVSGPGWAQSTSAIGPDPSCNVRSYGAVGDGVALDTRAIQAAIAACHERGGGVVVVPPGTYLTGTIHLQSQITLEIEPGATLLGTPDLKQYDRLAHASEERDTPLIVAEDVKNIAITGGGTIDGNGRAFTENGHAHFDPYFDPNRTRQTDALLTRMRAAREGPVKMLARPGILLLVLRGDGVNLHDFNVVDSPNWSVKVGCSDHVIVSRLHVQNSLLVPNSDGLDISTSHDVSVSDSILEAGDDALVIGGPCTDGWCQRTTENVVVSNVVLRSRSSALRIGPAAKDVRNLVFNNVTIDDSNRGISIQARVGELIENVSFSNVVSRTRLLDGPWWGAGEPISVTVAKWDRPDWAPAQTPGRIERLRFSHVIADSESPIVVYSTVAGAITDVRFEDVTLRMHSSALQETLGGNLDLQPTTPRSLGLTKQDLSAFLIRNVDDLSLRSVAVQWDGRMPEWYRSALQCDGCKDLFLDDFRGSGASSAYPGIALSGTTLRAKGSARGHQKRSR